jgi:hypothetical protein
MMSVCSTCAIVCLESITDDAARARVHARLLASGKEIIDITQAQVNAFCGNILEVRTASDEPALALSRRAYDAFDPAQRDALARAFANRLIIADFHRIETIGGGGVRCAIAESFHS